MRTIQPRRTAVTTWLVVLASVAACTEAPKVGGKCNMTDEGQLLSCLDPATALRCVKLRLQAIPCHGSLGCSGRSPTASCDATLADEGEACVGKEEFDSLDHTCSRDKSRSLECRDGHFVTRRLCRGPKGCATSGIVACDRILAAAGDPCARDSERACSVDGKTELACEIAPGKKEGAFAVASLCVGPTGCTPGHLAGSDIPWPHCDQSVATLGEPCGKEDTARSACSASATTVLVCDSTTRTYVREASCAPKSACVYSNETHRSSCQADSPK